MSKGERLAWGLASVVFGALVFVWLRKARGNTIINRVSSGVTVPAFTWPDFALPDWLGISPDAGGIFASSWNPCGCGCDDGGNVLVNGADVLPAAVQGPGPQDGAGGQPLWQSMFYFSELPNGTVH